MRVINKSSIFCAAALLSICNVCAQIVDTVWTKRFAENGDQIGMSTREVPNGDLLVFAVGYHNQPIIMKLNSNGNLLWKKSDTTLPYCTDFTYCTDNSIMLLGTKKTFNQPSDTEFCSVAKYDESMNLLWYKIYHNSKVKDLGNKIKQTKDNGFIIAGTSGIGDRIKLFCWVMKINSLGEKVWENRFGDTLSYHSYNNLWDILELPNNDGYVAVGVTTTSNIQNGCFVHFDINGNIVDKKSVDSLADIETVVRISDSTFMIGGFRHSNIGVTEPGSCNFIVDKKGNFPSVKTSLYFKKEIPALICGCNITNEYILLGGEYNFNNMPYTYVYQTNKNGDSLGSFKMYENRYDQVIHLQSISKNEVIMNFRNRDPMAINSNDDVAIAKLKINYPPFFKYVNKSRSDSCVEDHPYNLQLSADDSFPSDIIRYQLSDGNKAGMSLNDTSGVFSWKPLTEADSGNHTIKFICSDRLNQNDTFQLSLHVFPVNDPPEITTILPPIFKINTPYTINLTANDEERDSIVWTAVKKPINLTIDHNKLLWKPEIPGIDTIVLIASDGTNFDTLISKVQVIDPVETLNYNRSAPMVMSIASVLSGGQTNLVIGLPAGYNDGTLRIYNLSGKVIEWFTLHADGWQIIKLNKQHTGIYIATISAGGKSCRRLFVNR